MKTPDEIEREAYEKTKRKKAKMKVSGKSVFVLSKESIKSKKRSQ